MNSIGRLRIHSYGSSSYTIYYKPCAYSNSLDPFLAGKISMIFRRFVLLTIVLLLYIFFII